MRRNQLVYVGLHAAALVLGALACAKNDAPPTTSEFVPETDAGPSCLPGTGASATKTIGLAGGTVTLETLTVELPPNALAVDTPITLTSTTACPALGDDFVPASPIYEIDPAGVALSGAAKVTVRYTGADRGAFLFAADAAGDFVLRATALSGSAVSASVDSFTSIVAGTYARRSPFSLRASPPTIDFDGTSNLVLEVPLATSCTFAPPPDIPVTQMKLAGDAFALVGSAAVQPTSPTTYTATCTGPAGNATLSAKVDLAAVVDFQVRPTTLHAGEKVTINWTGRPQIAACELVEATENVHTGALPGTNTTTRTPPRSTTYTLLCLDAGHRLIARKQVKVEVIAAGADAGAETGADALDGG